MNLSAAKEVLLSTHLAGLDQGHRPNGVMMISGPGLGKSASVEQYCETLAARTNEPAGLVTFMLATISSVDVRGFMLPVKGTNTLDTVFSTPPWFPTKISAAVVEPDGTWHKPGTWQGDVPRIGAVFLDEFSQAEDDVKKPAAELIYKGNVGTCELGQGWRVVAAGNRMNDRSGVLRELMFIVNRRLLLNISAELPPWIDWCNKLPPAMRPHYLTMSFAQKNTHLVFRDEVPPGTDPFCTPRTLVLMDKDLRALRRPEDVAKDRMPTDPISREVCAGWIGGGEGAQFFTHLKYADELPDIDDIVKDPNKAKVPANRDAQMVCGYMLAHNITDKSSSQVLTYINRLHTEMQVLAVRTITSQQERAKTIASSQLFVDWLVKNKALLTASKS